ncbi:MAG: large conductance mechanosensitive channel protein MscL [Lachnospiraceae bacterium]|nr:large conductance mechanosensitive channel protein MscL [Lachnospiraceae bacterium]
MKKFMEEFKKFALKGNVMDMAVGVIIGGAFTTIVTSLTDNFINPLIALCTGGANGEGVVIGGTFTIGGVAFNYGAFLSAVINFLIMAFILFCMLKAINKLMSIGHKKEEPVKTTKICPYCKSEIPKDATKCAHCTSEVEVEE